MPLPTASNSANSDDMTAERGRVEIENERGIYLSTIEVIIYGCNDQICRSLSSGTGADQR